LPLRVARWRSRISAATTNVTLSLDGFLCFTDPAKADVQGSLDRLARLGITVKIVTGDNGQVAAHLCRDVGP